MGTLLKIFVGVVVGVVGMGLYLGYNFASLIQSGAGDVINELLKSL